MFSCIHLKFMFNEGSLQRLVQGTNLDVPNASKTVPIKLDNSSFTKAWPFHGQSLNVIIIILNVGEHDMEPIQKGRRVSPYSQIIFQASPIHFESLEPCLGGCLLTSIKGFDSTWSSNQALERHNQNLIRVRKLVVPPSNALVTHFTIRLLVVVSRSMGPNPSLGCGYLFIIIR
jgi:hypothetical protein